MIEQKSAAPAVLQDEVLSHRDLRIVADPDSSEETGNEDNYSR
jgi:hypothetical protein